MMAFDGIPPTFADRAPAQQPLVPGYTQGRLPHSITDDTQLDLAALFLLSYRVRQSPNWGTDRHALAQKFGFGEDSFYGAVKTLAEAGYMKRTTTKRRNLIWFARETLDFSNAPPPAPRRHGYQHLPNEMPILEGNETWRPLALLIYLNSWPLDFALTPKQIANRFDIHVTTVRRLMNLLVKSGLASKGKIAGKSGYIRLRRRAETAVTKVRQPDTEKVRQPDTEKERQPDIPYREGKTLGWSCASAMERVKAVHTCAALLPLKTSAATTSHVGDVTRGSAGATSSDCDDGNGTPSVATKPKQQRKAGARQKASTKPAKLERREWIAVQDADGEDVIERLKCNDLNGVLHPMLFRYDGIQELAEMLDTVERVAASFHGARFGALARNTAVHAIIGKLCGWATFAEMDEQGVRTWDYFDKAIQHEVQIAVEEMRHAA